MKKSWLSLLGLLAVAIVAVILPMGMVYEKDHVQRSNRSDPPFSALSTNTSITILVTGTCSDVGLACIYGLVQRAIASQRPLTIAMGCDIGIDTDTDAAADVAFRIRDTDSSRCNRARDQVPERVVEMTAKWGSSTVDGASNTPLVTLLSMPIDLRSSQSIEQFAVDLQKRLPKAEGVWVPPIHIMIHAENTIMSSISQPLEYISEPTKSPEKKVGRHIQTNHLGHALLTHHLWKNILAVKEEKPDRKARLITILSGWTLFPVHPDQGWFKAEATSSSILDPLWQTIANRKQYARSKQAQLYFAVELQNRYSDYITVGTSRGANSNFYFPGLPKPLRYLLGYNNVNMGMASPEEQEAQSILLAALDETAQYDGPKYVFFGSPVVVSQTTIGNNNNKNLNMGSVHHRAFSRESAQALFDNTIEHLKIAEFGQKSYKTMWDSNEYTICWSGLTLGGTHFR